MDAAGIHIAFGALQEHADRAGIFPHEVVHGDPGVVAADVAAGFGADHRVAAEIGHESDQFSRIGGIIADHAAFGVRQFGLGGFPVFLEHVFDRRMIDIAHPVQPDVAAGNDRLGDFDFLHLFQRPAAGFRDLVGKCEEPRRVGHAPAGVDKQRGRGGMGVAGADHDVRGLQFRVFFPDDVPDLVHGLRLQRAKVAGDDQHGVSAGLERARTGFQNIADPDRFAVQKRSEPVQFHPDSGRDFKFSESSSHCFTSWGKDVFSDS